ncbi:MAG: helix-turn-helix domain-containing protein [Myxococcota bacterium]
MALGTVWERWDGTELERFEATPVEELHLHDRFEVGFAETGALVLEGEKWSQTLEEGSGYLVGPGLVHRVPRNPQPSRFRRMFLTSTSAARMLSPVMAETSMTQPVLLAQSVLRSWWSRLETDTTQGMMLPAQPIRIRPKHPAVAKAVAFLRENINRTISLDELAKVCRVSKFHLCRIFHRTVGVTPRTFHRHIRLEASRDLLRRGRPSALVAYDLSFSDQSHFIRSFRKQFGTTPGDYLQALHTNRVRPVVQTAVGT